MPDSHINTDRKSWGQRAELFVERLPQGIVAAFIFLLTASVFVGDLLDGSGASDWLWYVFPLLLSVFIRRPKFPLWLASGLSILVTIGYFFTPLGVNAHRGLTAHLFSHLAGVTILWLVAVIIQSQIMNRLAAEANRERYRELFELESDAHFLVDRETYQVVDINQAAERLYGYSRAEFLKLKLDNFSAEPSVSRAAVAAGEHFVSIRWHRKKNGERFPVEITSNTFETQGRRLLLGAVRDISVRRQAEERIAQLSRMRAFLGGVDHAIVHLNDRQKLLEEICRLAVEAGGFKLAWIGMVRPDQTVQPVAQAGVSGYVENISATTTPDSQRGRGPVGMAIRENRMIVVENIGGDARMAPWRDMAQEFGLNYVVSCPIQIAAQTVGVFSVYAPQMEIFSENELSLLTQVSGDISFALSAMAESKARLDAEEKLRKLSRAVEQSPVSIMITNLSGLIEYVNPKFTSLTGYQMEEVLGQNSHLLKSGEMSAENYEQLWKTIRSGKEWRGQFHNRKKNGELFWEAASISPVFDNESRITHYIAVKEDITAAKIMEAKLQELAAIVQNSEDAIVSTTIDQTILSWNRGAEKLFGYPAEEMIGSSLFLLVPPDQTQQLKEVRTKIIFGESVEIYETARRHKDGTLRNVSVKVSPIHNQENKTVTVSAIYRDITAQKQLEKAVLEISAQERRRVGHELHDGLGQHLAGMAFKAKVLEQDLAELESPLTAEAKKIVELTNEAMQQTRQLASGFDPVEIEVGGLPTALEKFAQQIARSHRVGCNFSCNEQQLNLDKQINLALFRIAQEATNNALRHGHARQINITLHAIDSQLTMTIRDDGKGFKPAGEKHHGRGLGIMGYRANNLGGKLLIRSTPGVGTEIECVFQILPDNSSNSSQASLT